jgi:hypothetical protein
MCARWNAHISLFQVKLQIRLNSRYCTMHHKGNIAVSSDGTNIHFDVKGNGDVALVFVHGWCCDRTYWNSQLNYFASNDTVVTLDVAGHGASGKGRKKWTVPAFGRDIVAVMDHLKLPGRSSNRTFCWRPMDRRSGSSSTEMCHRLSGRRHLAQCRTNICSYPDCRDAGAFSQ